MTDDLGPTDSSPAGTATERFLALLRARTKDPVHLRLIAAAQKPGAAAALEKELVSIVEEILREA